MRRRILITIAASTALVLLAFLLPLAVLVQTVAESRATTSATLRIQPFAGLVATVPRDKLEVAVDQVNADGGYPVTIYLPNGSTLGAASPETDAVRLAQSGTTLTADGPDGREIAVAVIDPPKPPTVIRVLVPPDELDAGVTRARLSLLGLAVVLLLLALAVGDALARSFVKPAEELAETAESLAKGDLAARVEPSGPRETKLVGTALNRLAHRVGDLLVAEREAVADLSHRLRTPVTALRLDAESLADEAERNRITDDVEQLSRTVDAVINEARRPVREGVQARCDAEQVLRERARFWSALAEDEGREATISIPAQPAWVRCSAADLAAAFDAVLGNVFAHTPEGTGFQITLSAPAAGGVDVLITDQGPGWPLGSDIGARGVSGAGSTGLGLDIAARTAHASGGGLTTLSGPEGGAGVLLHLSAPAD
ncbi:MAG TPA: HAMP domain-containing sensor histidine kinase [Actinomycetes bacterium]|nr:HAMP domain-containing sensor histidine kinase [Actinomycetes bacterium]